MHSHCPTHPAEPLLDDHGCYDPEGECRRCWEAGIDERAAEGCDVSGARYELLSYFAEVL